ncbi:hypothetical protein AB4Z50_06575 [Paenibacillus sp. 2TAB26]|uniref:hypothetical protein n=1 Tax=Paenibacillus sp. 2TAB26 TaxID=3233005 RepID=UPI003F9D74BE
MINYDDMILDADQADIDIFLSKIVSSYTIHAYNQPFNGKQSENINGVEETVYYVLKVNTVETIQTTSDAGGALTLANVDEEVMLMKNRIVRGLLYQNYGVSEDEMKNNELKHSFRLSVFEEENTALKTRVADIELSLIELFGGAK